MTAQFRILGILRMAGDTLINIKVLFFARSRELVGTSQTSATVPLGTTLAGLEEYLFSQVSIRSLQRTFL